MPSLTLAPAGEERSMINFHFPGLFHYRIAPIGLICSLFLGGRVRDALIWVFTNVTITNISDTKITDADTDIYFMSNRYTKCL